MNDIFSSTEKYKKIFNNGLITLAQDDGLGTFILAMANATFDQEIYQETKTILRTNFIKLQEKYIESFI